LANGSVTIDRAPRPDALGTLSVIRDSTPSQRDALSQRIPANGRSPPPLSTQHLIHLVISPFFLQYFD
jgi:hypothetical protein